MQRCAEFDWVDFAKTKQCKRNYPAWKLQDTSSGGVEGQGSTKLPIPEKLPQRTWSTVRIWGVNIYIYIFFFSSVLFSSESARPFCLMAHSDLGLGSFSAYSFFLKKLEMDEVSFSALFWQGLCSLEVLAKCPSFLTALAWHPWHCMMAPLLHILCDGCPCHCKDSVARLVQVPPKLLGIATFCTVKPTTAAPEIVPLHLPLMPFSRFLVLNQLLQKLIPCLSFASSCAHWLSGITLFFRDLHHLFVGRHQRDSLVALCANLGMFLLPPNMPPLSREVTELLIEFLLLESRLLPSFCSLFILDMEKMRLVL